MASLAASLSAWNSSPASSLTCHPAEVRYLKNIQDSHLVLEQLARDLSPTLYGIRCARDTAIAKTARNKTGKAKTAKAKTAKAKTADT